MSSSYDNHAVLIDSNGAMCLPSFGFDVSSYLNMCELIGCCIKLINSIKYLVLKVKASIEEDFMFVVS